MGDKEQSGMLRVVVVLGLIAVIAAVVIFSVLSFKPGLRRNIVVTSTLGQNVLDIKQTGTDAKYKFNNLTGATGIAYDKDTQIFTLSLASKAGNQGMYYGPASTDASTDYNAFLAGDSYQLTADMRTDNPDLIDSVDYYIHFESSKTNKTGGMYLHPKMTSEWQHYETNGVKLAAWGAPMIYFNNKSGQPVKVQIKNIEMRRTP